MVAIPLIVYVKWPPINAKYVVFLLYIVGAHIVQNYLSSCLSRTSHCLTSCRISVHYYILLSYYSYYHTSVAQLMFCNSNAAAAMMMMMIVYDRQVSSQFWPSLLHYAAVVAGCQRG